MKNIFGNFDLVPKNEKGYVEKLEQEYDIFLPPIFKVFCQTFILNSLKPNNNHHLFHPDEELGFDGFEFNLKDLLGLYQEVGEPHFSRKMIPIATSSVHSGGICVCYGYENIDGVFVNDEMSDNDFVQIATNIFDFVSQIQQFNFSNSNS